MSIRIPVTPITLDPGIDDNRPKVVISEMPTIEPTTVAISRKDSVGDGCNGFERISLTIRKKRCLKTIKIEKEVPMWSQMAKATLCSSVTSERIP